MLRGMVEVESASKRSGGRSESSGLSLRLYELLALLLPDPEPEPEPEPEYRLG